MNYYITFIIRKKHLTAMQTETKIKTHVSRGLMGPDLQRAGGPRRPGQGSEPCTEEGLRAQRGLGSTSGPEILAGAWGNVRETPGITLTSAASQLLRRSTIGRHGILSFCDSPSLNQLHGDR